MRDFVIPVQSFYFRLLFNVVYEMIIYLFLKQTNFRRIATEQKSSKYFYAFGLTGLMLPCFLKLTFFYSIVRIM